MTAEATSTPATQPSHLAAGPFSNRVALITGAGSGLGRHLAMALAAQGAAVAAIDLKEEGLVQLAADLPGKPLAWAVADVTDRLGLRAAARKLQEQVGPVDLLIANAGIGIEMTALLFRAVDIEAQVRVNLVGVANSIEAVLSGMLKRGTGHLVAISSLASYRGIPGMAGYSASKAGLNALLESIRVELTPRGIAVTIVCPGWIRTPLTERLGVPLPDLMEPDDAARRILDAIRRRRPFYAFPRPLVRRLRLLRWLPCGASDWILSRMVRGLRR